MGSLALYSLAAAGSRWALSQRSRLLDIRGSLASWMRVGQKIGWEQACSRTQMAWTVLLGVWFLSLRSTE